jgi:hypothetical protein
MKTSKRQLILFLDNISLINMKLASIIRPTSGMRMQEPTIERAT